MALSKAAGPGNWVVYVGAKTGRDGVHGASMASESFDDKSEAKKPNVQIGDPFFEKLLIEACLEILKQNLVVAMQDMGAAGLTSSSFEMSSKGGVGMTLELDQVPVRDSSITPEEILLSESQERMLLVCTPDKFEAISKVFKKWDLEATKIGEIQTERKVHLKWKNETLVQIDPDPLVENAPRYERPYQAWKWPRVSTNSHLKVLENQPLSEVLPRLLKDHRLGSKEWIYRQYDQRVGLRTVRDARNSVAFISLPTGRGLAISVGCRPSLMRLDVELGAFEAVFGPALQMAAKGARALAVTDCLNFGNPEKPDMMSEFVTSVEAIALAARELDAPVISGNVSFYNETLGQNITPTPAMGVVGLRDDIESIPVDHFTEAGLQVVCVSCPLVQSSYRVAEILGEKSVFSGRFDPKQAARFVRFIEGTVQAYPVVASRVVAEGGLAVAISRMSQQGFGMKARLEEPKSTQAWLSEDFFEVLLVVRPEHSESLVQETARMGFEAEIIGDTTLGVLDFGMNASWSTEIIAEWSKEAWTLSLGDL